jgi:mannose-6-phosphate isomerase-like protein (cupin superfamily)
LPRLSFVLYSTQTTNSGSNPGRRIMSKTLVKFKNSEKCTAYEYPLDDKDINMALVLINGRYPDKGRVTNEKVKEIILVTKGKGKIIIENNEHELKEGDAVLLLPKQRYFYEGNNLQIVSACSPAWYPEQHKLLEK